MRFLYFQIEFQRMWKSISKPFTTSSMERKCNGNFHKNPFFMTSSLSFSILRFLCQRKDEDTKMRRTFNSSHSTSTKWEQNEDLFRFFRNFSSLRKTQQQIQSQFFSHFRNSSMLSKKKTHKLQLNGFQLLNSTKTIFFQLKSENSTSRRDATAMWTWKITSQSMKWKRNKNEEKTEEEFVEVQSLKIVWGKISEPTNSQEFQKLRRKLKPQDFIWHPPLGWLWFYRNIDVSQLSNFS